MNREKNPREKIKDGTSKPYLKKHVLRIIEPEQVEQQVTPPTRIQMWTYHIG